jgi:hypothetical protein
VACIVTRPVIRQTVPTAPSQRRSALRSLHFTPRVTASSSPSNFTPLPPQEKPPTPCPFPTIEIHSPQLPHAAMQTFRPPDSKPTPIPSTEVDWAPLLRLHRHADGYLSFAVAREDDWRPIYAFRADRLETMFPEIRNHLLRDRFVSINAAHRAAGRNRTAAPGGINLPLPRSETLRYLCACYCGRSRRLLTPSSGRLAGTTLSPKRAKPSCKPCRPGTRF